MASLYHFLLVVTLLIPATTAICVEYNFGIVPQQSTTKMAKAWIPVIDYLSKHSHIKLKFSTAPSIPIFEKRLATGEYDLAYMNPYHYVTFHDKSGYNAFIKAKDKKIRGIIVVRKDSEFHQLSDLNNQTVAFPSPNAFAATMLPLAYARQNNIHLKPAYINSHDSVYRNVAYNSFTAGGGVIRTLRSIEPSISQQLRILWMSDEYTPHAFAYHPRIPSEVVTSVSQAMLDMQKTEDGPRLLSLIKLAGFDAATDSEWNDIRKLQILSSEE